MRVEDITFTQEGIEIFMRRHKTDVFNEGAVCTVVERGRAFDVRGFLEEYLERMGLVRGNCVFPKNLDKGNKGVAVAYPMMYRGLEDMKGRLGLEDNLTWHSWRIGAATKVEDEQNQVDQVPYQEPISPIIFRAITLPGTKKSQNFVSRNLTRKQLPYQEVRA